MRYNQMFSILILFSAIASGRTFSSRPVESTWVTNGPVSVIEQHGDKVYIGGGFTYVGPNNGCFGIVDTATGTLRTGFPRVNGEITAMAADSRGGWFISGNFETVGTYKRLRIAHILPDFSVDPQWDPGSARTHWVYEIVVHGNDVWVGGAFDSIGGQVRKNIACIDAATGRATSWNTTVTGTVFALVAEGNRLYIAGDFDSLDGQRRNSLASVDIITGRVTDWNPDPRCTSSRPYPTAYINTLSMRGDKVYVGGAFDTMGGQPRNNIAAVDTITGKAFDWNPDARQETSQITAGTVSSIEPAGDRAYVFGLFDTIGGQARNGVACLDLATGLASAWNPEIAGSVYGSTCQGNLIYITGSITAVDGKIRNNCACIDALSGQVTDWSVGTNSVATAIVPGGNSIAIAGIFTSIGGKTRSHFACLDAATGQATDWDPAMSSTLQYGTPSIDAIICSGNNVYVGGSFTKIGGQQRNSIACLDATTGLATAWNPEIRMSENIFGGSVSDMCLSGKLLYIGGYFDAVGGKQRNCIACLDITTGAPADWNPGANQSIYKCSLVEDRLYVCGAFDTIGGTPRKNIACIDATTGTVTGWNPNPNSPVYTILASADKVYAGGQFSAIGGAQRDYVACIDPISGNATDWNPEARDNISALGISGNTVFIGGWDRCLAVDALTGQKTDWTPDVSTTSDEYRMSVFSVGEKYLFIGGNFTEAGGLPCANVAQFDSDAIPVKQRPYRTVSTALSTKLSGNALQYSIDRHAPVLLQLFNTAGRMISAIDCGSRIPGTYHVSLNDLHLPAGRYLLKLETGNSVIAEPFTLVR